MPRRVPTVSRSRARSSLVQRLDPWRHDIPWVVLGVLLGLTGVSLLLTLTQSGWFPVASLILPVVLGSLLLARPHLLMVDLAVVLSLAVLLATQERTGTRLTVVVVILAVMAVLLRLPARHRLGVGGALGESMLIDLRDRLRQQGELPSLPPDWYAQSVTRSAGGAQFAGDFVTAAVPHGGSTLEVVVVDVSGKGVPAGSRALLLSGAFGGLLGALPAEAFLPAANDYLLRQNWPEGFATAVHLTLDLATGEYEVRKAGHPPAVHWSSGSGRWRVLASRGPVLGVIEAGEFDVVRGRMLTGDVLMLYTDGLVETARRDFTLGIDKMIGQAERQLLRGWEGSAERLLDTVAETGDDRAIVVLHRR